MVLNSVGSEQGPQTFPGLRQVARTPGGQDRGGLCHTLSYALLSGGSLSLHIVSGPDRKWVSAPLWPWPGPLAQLQVPSRTLVASRTKGRPGQGEEPEGRERQA